MAEPAGRTEAPSVLRPPSLENPVDPRPLAGDERALGDRAAALALHARRPGRDREDLSAVAGQDRAAGIAGAAARAGAARVLGPKQDFRERRPRLQRALRSTPPLVPSPSRPTP